MSEAKELRTLRVPATTNQQGICLQLRLQTNSRALLLARELALTGLSSTDPVILAIQRIHRRQPSLRSRFIFEGGQFWMEPVAPDTGPSIEVMDIGTLTVPSGGSVGEQAARLLARSRFDPEEGPLARFAILCRGGVPNLLVVVWHHVISDEESWLIFCDELLRELGGEAVPGPTSDYLDYARAQALQTGSEICATASQYWRDRFRPVPAPLRLLGVRVPPAFESDSGEILEQALPDDLVARLSHLRAGRGVSTFRILLSAAFVLAHRLSGETDLTIGTTLRNRGFPGSEKIIGYFNNQAALRVELDPDDSFLEAIRKVDHQLTEAARHEGYPFSLLLQETGMARAAHPWPFNFTKLPSPRCSVPTRHLPLGTSAHPLAFYCSVGRGQVLVRAEYLRECCDATTVRRLLRQYVELLSALVAAPEEAIAHHSFITAIDGPYLPDARRPLDCPRYPRALEAFEGWVDRAPDSVAIRQQGQSILYSQLADGIRHYAAILGAHGVTQGAVVAVTGEISPGLVAAAMAVWRVGAILLLIDPKLPSSRTQRMLREGRVSHQVNVGPVDAGGVVEAQNGIIAISLGGALPLVEPGTPVSAAARSTEDPAYVFFTSGTTGTPKAVLGSHQGLGHFLAWQRSTFGVGPGDRVAQLTGLSFDVILREVFLPLTSGATLCLPDPGSDLAPDHVLPWIQREGITLIHTVPSLARVWVAHPPAGVELSSLRCVFLAGEPLPDLLVTRFRQALRVQARIINLYGPTETTLAKCFHEVADPPEPGIQPVGRPQPQTQALILSPARRPCAVGEPGEIAIRTPYRSHGYLNSAEETARRFIPNPFRSDPNDLLYLTGDRGMFRSDGSIAILGRLDFQVKIRGVRIEPGEVEAVLSSNAGVAAAAVVAVQTPSDGYRLAGYFVPKPGCAPSASDLRAHLRHHLPESHLPESFTALDSMPITPNGKLDRQALPVPVWSSTVAAQGRPPTSPTELVIAGIWTRLLKLPAVDAETSFFDLGGHSLLALRMIADLRRETGFDLSLPDLFHQPTVEAIARRMDQANVQNVPDPLLQSLTPIRVQGSGPVLFLFPGGNGGDRELYVHVSICRNHLDPDIRLYALRARGHKAGTLPHLRMREMVDDYIREMQTVTDGPFHLIGDCTGGNIAFEVARQLQDQGLDVGLLALCDCAYPRPFEYQRYWVETRYRRFRQGLAGRMIFAVAKIPMLLTREGRETWRAALGRLAPKGRGRPGSAASGSENKEPELEYWTPLGERYRRTATTHSPRRFRGSLIHFVSDTNAANPRMLAWARAVSGGQSIRVLHGDHWHYLWNNGPLLSQTIASVIKPGRLGMPSDDDLPGR